MSSASILEAEEYLKMGSDLKQLEDNEDSEDAEEIEYLKRVIEDEKAIREAGQRSSDVKYMNYNTNIEWHIYMYILLLEVL